MELTARGKSLAKAKVQRGIIHGDELSSLLFVIAMMSFNHIIRKCTGGFTKLTKAQEKLNHVMNMDDKKLFAKNEKNKTKTKPESEENSDDIGMKFVIEKCAMLIMKSGKRQMTEGRELLNQEKIRTLGKEETYEFLGILEIDIIKQVEIKEKIKKEYPWRTRKLLETKLFSRNFIKGINPWAALPL